MDRQARLRRDQVQDVEEISGQLDRVHLERRKAEVPIKLARCNHHTLGPYRRDRLYTHQDKKTPGEMPGVVPLRFRGCLLFQRHRSRTRLSLATAGRSITSWLARTTVRPAVQSQLEVIAPGRAPIGGVPRKGEHVRRRATHSVRAEGRVPGTC